MVILSHVSKREGVFVSSFCKFAFTQNETKKHFGLAPIGQQVRPFSHFLFCPPLTPHFSILVQFSHYYFPVSQIEKMPRLLTLLFLLLVEGRRAALMVKRQVSKKQQHGH
jgi:hypothetical protein